MASYHTPRPEGGRGSSLNSLSLACACAPELTEHPRHSETLGFAFLLIKVYIFSNLRSSQPYTVWIIKLSFLMEKHLLALENVSVSVCLTEACLNKLLNPRVPAYHPMLSNTTKREDI